MLIINIILDGVLQELIFTNAGEYWDWLATIKIRNYGLSTGVNLEGD